MCSNRQRNIPVRDSTAARVHCGRIQKRLRAAHGPEIQLRDGDLRLARGDDIAITTTPSDCSAGGSSRRNLRARLPLGSVGHHLVLAQHTRPVVHHQTPAAVDHLLGRNAPGGRVVLFPPAARVGRGGFLRDCAARLVVISAFLLVAAIPAEIGSLSPGVLSGAWTARGSAAPDACVSRVLVIVETLAVGGTVVRAHRFVVGITITSRSGGEGRLNLLQLDLRQIVFVCLGRWFLFHHLGEHAVVEMLVELLSGCKRARAGAAFSTSVSIVVARRYGGKDILGKMLSGGRRRRRCRRRARWRELAGTRLVAGRQLLLAAVGRRLLDVVHGH